MYTNNKTDPCTSVIQHCVNCSFISVPSVGYSVAATVTSVSIFQPISEKARSQEHKQGPGLALCSTETNRKQPDPQHEIQRQALKGKYLQRGQASCLFDVCSVQSPEASCDVEDTFATCCDPFCMTAFYTWPHSAQCKQWLLASRERAHCTAPLLLSLIISPSHYLPSSLCFLNSAFCSIFLNKIKNESAWFLIEALVKHPCTGTLCCHDKPKAKGFILSAQVGIYK